MTADLDPATTPRPDEHPETTVTTDRIPLRTALTAGVWATPRPLPTADRCGHTPDQHLALSGLEADLRTARRDADELRAERDQARAALRRVATHCDAIEAIWDGNGGEVARSIRETVEHIRAVAGSREPLPGSAPDHAQGEPTWDNCATVANALANAPGTGEIWRDHHGDITGAPLSLARVAVEALAAAGRLTSPPGDPSATPADRPA